VLAGVLRKDQLMPSALVMIRLPLPLAAGLVFVICHKMSLQAAFEQ